MKDTREEKNVEILIDSLGVFELRGVARQLGVPSPTTKKRDELVDLIKEAIENGATIKDSIPKRGRPFKRLNILDSITNQINNEVVRNEFSNTKKVVKFAQDNFAPLDLAEFEGIVLKYNLAIEMRDIVTGSLVKIEKTEQLNELLETGDKVRVTVNLVDDVYYANKILAVNDVEFNEYRSKFVDKGNKVISNIKVPFANNEAVLGRRNLYKLDSELFENNYLQDLLEYCNKEGFVLIPLAINTSFENEIMFSSLPTKNKFVTTYGANSDLNYHKVLDALNYAQNLLDRGKKVILFTADVIEIVKALDKYFTSEDDTQECYDESTLLVIQKLLSYAHSYSQGCSGTLIMCYNSVDSENKFLINDLLKISNKMN